MATKKKLLLILSIVFGGIIVAGGVTTPILLLTGVKVTLLSNEGVMIEAKGVRLYIDPIYFPQSYDPKPADVVMVTHPHSDHYQPSVITTLQKEDTVNIFPEDMSDAIALFNGTGMVPEDVYNLTDEISITAFYEYTIPDGNHPRNANWTSYLVDINGFTIFHAGDAGNMPEYEQLNGIVDLAMLPYVPGFLITNSELVEVFNIIQPKFAMLIHGTFNSYTAFFDAYGDSINAKAVILDELSSRRFY